MLRGLSLRVPPGRIVALLGANGAGKTTAIRAVAGLLPYEKRCGHRGIDPARRTADRPHAGPSRRARRRLVAVLEGRRVFADLTVDDNLRAASWALRGRRAHPRGGLEAVYRFFPLLEARRRHRAGYLSGGEQQMLAIGRALLTEPAVMVLDEPSLGLAPRLREEIFTGIARINRERGVSMLLVEQNAAMALDVARYGYVMEQGRVVVEGPADTLKATPQVREAYLGSGSGGGADVQRRPLQAASGDKQTVGVGEGGSGDGPKAVSRRSGAVPLETNSECSRMNLLARTDHV